MVKFNSFTLYIDIFCFFFWVSHTLPHPSKKYINGTHVLCMYVSEEKQERKTQGKEGTLGNLCMASQIP